MTRVQLGADVRCDGNVVGTVGDVVVDPVARRLTHVVLRTSDEEARLIPATVVVEGHRGVLLTCTPEELKAFEQIREFAYLELDERPHGDGKTDIGVQELFAVPQYEATELGDYVGDFESLVGVTYDRIPKGDAEFRRTSDVVDAQGEHLGHVDGLVVDGGVLTHVVVEHGHLWRKRDVAIPIELVAALETDTVAVSVPRSELKALPRSRPGRPLRFH
jgi:sporulation protein YlmC with PRC-barrel domain